MPGIAEIALGAAPIAGGALLGVAAGNLKPPDVRGQIKQDFDLLDRHTAGRHRASGQFAAQHKPAHRRSRHRR